MQLPNVNTRLPGQPAAGLSAVHIVILLLVFLSALGVRLLYVSPDNENVKLLRDEKEYFRYAHNLIHHQTFSKDPSKTNPVPDSYRSPGYPMLIALAMKTGGSDGYLSILFTTQAVLGALLAPLAYMAGILFLPLPAAIGAALLTAFSPHLITIATCVLTETLFSFLLLAAVCGYLYAHVRKSTPLSILSAVMFGFAYLVNEIAFFLPVVIAVISLACLRIGWRNIFGNHASRRICLFLAVFALFPAGWMLRNGVSLPPEAKRGSDRAVTTLSHGAYPNFIYKDPKFQRFPYREDPEQPAFGSSLGQFVKILSQRVRQEPARYLTWYVFGKPYYLWRWSILQGAGDIYIIPLSADLFAVSRSAGAVKIFLQMLHPWLLMLAALGVVLLSQRCWKERVPADRLWLPVHCFAVCIYATVLYTVFAPWPRYSIPFRPELYLCAMWAVQDLIQRVQFFRVPSA